MTPNEFIKVLEENAEDYAPSAPKVVVEGDFRPRVILPGHGGRLLSDFASDLGEKLGTKPICNRGGVVVVPREKKLVMLSSSAFRSLVEQWVVCQGWVGRAENCHLEDMTMNEECARATMVSNNLLSKLDEVRRVNNVRQPVRREDGTVELLPVGYDESSLIYTFDACDFDEEMEIGDAMAVIEKLLADCAFSPTDKDRTFSATIAMMLGAFCDCMFAQRVKRPVFIVQANTAGAGKTTLVQMAIAPVFGATILTPPPPAASQEKVMELLHAIAQSGAAYVVFDNWRGNVQNAALEAFISANMWGGRVLGTSFTFEVEKQCLVFITANDAIMNEDMRRRSLIIELFVEQMRAADRPMSAWIDEDDILAARSQILAALWSFTRNWITKDSKPGSILRGDFPKWGLVIGGIIEALGLPNPLTEPKLIRGGETALESFQKVIPSVFEGQMATVEGGPLDGTRVPKNEVYLRPAELLELARKVGAFPWFLNSEVEDASKLSDKEQRSERTAFARACDKFTGRAFADGTRFDTIGEGHAKRYKFTRPEPA